MLLRSFLAPLGVAVALMAAGCAGTQPQPAPTAAAVSLAAGLPDDNAPFWTGQPDAAELANRTDARLALAKRALDQLVAVTGKRTVANTLAPYDEILRQLDMAGSQDGVIAEVHPDSSVRSAAEDGSQRLSAFGTALSINRDVYNALAAVDTSSADPETRYYLRKTLRDYRLSGVDKDDATRAKITALRDSLTLIGQAFGRNIRDDVKTVTVHNARDLVGLPADFIARHQPGADGLITLTINYPDAVPVLTYATNDSLRRAMYFAYNTRAYPVNMAVLDRMIARRDELAHLLGYPSWAAYITADKMIGSATHASSFIDQIVAASGDAAQREYGELLARKRQDQPNAMTVNAWESSYYAELLRRSSYGFDAQQARPYFAYDKVKAGVLGVTSKLFGVSYRKVPDAPVWDPSVECYEMIENGQTVGRFYLDMHPRDGKYNHAAQFGARTGIAGRQIPEAVLVCNFPGGEPGDPGLMEHSDVRTFFHEFGHLVHTLLSGRHQWVGVGGISLEWDFVEAPSQLLEEWTWDPKVLATFATHYQTNQPIPADLVRQMKRAGEFGKALNVRNQMRYAKLSLSLYDRAPAKANSDSLVRVLSTAYSPFPFVDGAHMQTAFGHLDGYSAIYYTYMWSLVIAKDLFSQFNHDNLLDPAPARRYRDAILAPGGSAPAATLVQNFLGRPSSFAAWQAWLNEKP